MKLSPLAKLCIRGVAMQDYLQSQASSHAALPGNEATHTQLANSMNLMCVLSAGITVIHHLVI